jgi:yeast amino acid transporter
VLGFIGVESTAVATFEAKTHSDIVYPALFVHWAVYFMYFFLTVAIAVAVSWQDPELPQIFGNTIQGRNFSVTITAMESLNETLAGFVNACLIVIVLSAGNSAMCTCYRFLNRLFLRAANDHCG